MSNRSLAIHHLQTAVLCAVMARCKINLHEPAGMVASWQHCPKFREVQICTELTPRRDLHESNTPFVAGWFVCLIAHIFHIKTEIKIPIPTRWLSGANVLELLV